MTNPAVAVHGLTKIFSVPFHRQSIVAVKDLNLRIEPGEVYGLLGPNGSGKSTTLKIILGLVSPTRGRTEIFGRDSRLVQSRDAVGFLPENPYFQKFLTGKETLRFFGRLCGLRGAKLKNRVNELLDLVEQFVHAILQFCASQSAKTPEETKRLLASKKLLEVRILWQKTDRVPALYETTVPPEDFRAATRWRYEAENNLQSGAFTGAIRPEQPVHLTRLDAKVEILHRDNRLPMKRNGKNFG